jgi:AGZA family xanthine/uracil permease-like MFS transporter
LSALFLAPLFLAIPASATAPVLVLVGLMMVSGSVSKIDFSDYSEAVPAFLCIIFMPLSYSISEGIVIGHLSYVLINLCCGRVKKISVAMCALAIFFMLKFFL